MKILLIHNFYQQPGGEDVVFRKEKELLEEHGHEVIIYSRHNNEINEIGILNKVKVALRTIYNRSIKQEILPLIKKHRPDIAHIHNTFPLISPSIYHVLNELKIPIVQSLHNPRLLCPSAGLYRNGSLCEKCIMKKLPWPGIIYGCYQNSRIKTAVVALMLSFHNIIKTWQTKVDAYIVFTEFYKNKFINSGFPNEKIFIKPHFISPDPKPRNNVYGKYALYIGRLEETKGIFRLLEAWKNIKSIPLKIRGDGDLLNYTTNFIKNNKLKNIEIVGRLNERELINLIKDAKFLVWPSQGHYETFGLVAVESFACGVPVIASKVGVNAEIVTNGVTGLHFNPADPVDLAKKVMWANSHSEQISIMGINARKEYEAKYTAEKNYEMLMEIYHQAIEDQRKSEK